MTPSPASSPADTATASVLQPQNVLYLLTSTLLSPLQLFRAIAVSIQQGGSSTPFLVGSLILFVLVIAASPIIQTIWHGGEPDGLIWQIPLKVIWAMGLWGMVNSTLLLIPVLTQRPHPVPWRVLLSLTALSTVPYLLMGPIALLKQHLGGLGVVIGLFGGLMIWAWMGILYLMALSVSFQLRAMQTLLLVSLPFSLSLVALVWSGRFIAHMIELVP